MKHGTAGLLAIMIWFGAATAPGAETAAPPPTFPRALGEVSLVDMPILRVPLLVKPPTIDGVMQPGEWDDAAALSAFWYDYYLGLFHFMAPQQTQLQVYAGYDRDQLYFCVVSPVYPEGSWLRQRGRYSDVLEHPLYGMLWDDHVELELRPLEDLTRGYELGLLRWDVNPLNSVTDWYFSKQTGRDFGWSSQARIRTKADDKRWVVEYAIPLQSLRYGGYDAKDADGQPLVAIPPREGSGYRAWVGRGIGGNGAFFNVFDRHGWNTTKTLLVFDPKSPVFQINDLGPIMEGKVDLQLTVKNHNTRSETVRIGFHVESPTGPLYSSHQSPETPGGLVELRPGEVRKLRLTHTLEGVAVDGNVLWFDVRSLGEPAKTLFRTRLIGFHLMDGGVGGTPARSFRERRLDAIEQLRPPRVPFFDLRVDVSPYTRKLAAVVDRGIAGVSDEVKTAVRAQLRVKHLGRSEEIIHESLASLNGNFATFLVEVPKLVSGESYEVTVILFDENMKIVGEQSETKPFVNLTIGADPHTPTGRGEKFNATPWLKTVASEDRTRPYYLPEDARETRRSMFEVAPWLNGKIGLGDQVWEPFTPLAADERGCDTLKHRFTVDASGLPAQIDIRPDPRELPLELRGAGAKVPPQTLLELGRGPQLRAPLRLETVVQGNRVPAKVLTAAKAVRVGQSEIEYAAKLGLGPLAADLVTRYDCDGSLHATLTYGSDTAAVIDRLELVADIAGLVDLMLSETGNGDGFTGADRAECSLPNRAGVLWDSTMTKMPLFYSRFVPWFWFGSADRGWSYYSDSDEGWILDRDGAAMQLERDMAGAVTWRVAFVNHPATVKGRRTLSFSLLTHPAKPKPANWRRHAWHYFVGHHWAAEGRLQGDWGKEPNFVAFSYSEESFLRQWRQAAGAPADIPDYEREHYWGGDEPPFIRYSLGASASFFLPERNQLFTDKALFYLERFARLGRRTGLWLDGYAPQAISTNLAMGNAWLRRPGDIVGDELPLQSQFLTGNQRDTAKRLARTYAANHLRSRHHTRSNNSARLLESFLWNSALFMQTGAEAKAYDLDLLTVYPNSLYRTMGMNYTGLSATLVPDRVVASSGDNPRFDRQALGLGLLHDFGVVRDGRLSGFVGGPLGGMQHQEQGVRLLDRLEAFGFFNDADVEKLPFWRNDALVRLGDRPGDDTKVRVTVYRRPGDTGKGCQAIFVILNESPSDVELPLDIRDPQRVLGGPNTLRARDVLARARVPAILQATWAADGGGDAPVLTDLETGGLVTRAGDQGERYGPVFVPYHDYRILYAQSAR